MPSAPDFPLIDQTQLFTRLDEGAAGGITVITPNQRLSSALVAEFDVLHAAAGRIAWESADVLPLSAFVQRLHGQSQYGASPAASLMLLRPAQEQLLWEDIIAASDWGDSLLSAARTADEARRAWTLAHQWNIAGMLGHFPGNEDAAAFAVWASQYRRRTAEQSYTDLARLPDAVAELLSSGEVGAPRTLVLYAFDIVTPQLRALLSACRAGGSEVLSCAGLAHEADVTRRPLASAREELQRAANWARARLEAAVAGARLPRIGVVVPDLELRRKDIARAFSRALDPAFDLPGAEGPAGAPLFNLSLGMPLSQYPLVHAALGLMALALGPVDFALVSRLLRSPFIAGARSEAMARARLDLALRRALPPRVTLARLLAGIEGAGIAVPALQTALRALRELTSQGMTRRPMDRWAEFHAALLKSAGFPGERSLDSAEYQTLAKWNEVLAEFGALARVSANTGGSEALARLRRLCAETLFQPESGTAPIQVLGVLESAGLNFDHLWVSGLTDEAWPLAARPHAFIPPALQKKAGVPEAAAETALELDRRITQGWLRAAPEVVLSHPLHDEDRELSPSPLIVHVPEGEAALPQHASIEALIAGARALEPIPDAAAPALAALQVRGGARVLADQSACAFRAFAAHRLAAQPMESPAQGLDAAARGNLLHALMKGIWDELKTQSALLAIAPQELDAVIERAAAAAVARVRRDVAIGDALAALECRRLARLAVEWLEVERTRPPFEVAASEEKRPLAAAGVVFAGRIDRMDRLADGSHALIDYKTGNPTPKWWGEGVPGERPQDPQLPLYAVNAAEPVSAVVFAKLKTGGMRLMGYSRDPGTVHAKVKHYHDWDQLMAGWKTELHRLGADFAAGMAEVDPKQPGLTCRYCTLAPLCRVHERFSALELEQGLSEAAETGATGEGEAEE